MRSPEEIQARLNQLQREVDAGVRVTPVPMNPLLAYMDGMRWALASSRKLTVVTEHDQTFKRAA